MMLRRYRSDRPGRPTHISIFPTPGGWRHSTWTTKRHLMCGDLEDIPADAAVDVAKETALKFVNYVGSKFHWRDANLTIVWKAGDDGWWLGTVERRDGKPF